MEGKGKGLPGLRAQVRELTWKTAFATSFGKRDGRVEDCRQNPSVNRGEWRDRSRVILGG